MSVVSNEAPIDPHIIDIARQLNAMRPNLGSAPAGWRGDAATSITTTARQLVEVMAETLRQEFPECIGIDLLAPPAKRASLGKTQFTWNEQETRGKVLITPTMVQDSPSADVGIEEQPMKRFAWIQTKYGWTQQDIWTSQETGVSLERERADAAKELISHAHDDILLIGDGTSAYGGLTGLFKLSGTLTYTIDAGATSGATLWASKTGEEIFTDLMRWFHKVRNDTNTIEMPNTTVLPETAWQIALEKRMGDANQQDPIEHFLEVVRKKVPNYKVTSSIKLNNLGAGNTGRAITYVAADNKRVFRNDVVEFMQLNPVIVGTGVEVHCFAKTGGAIAPRKKSICMTDGL